MILHEDLVDFLESGVSILVGTRDAELWPHCMRAMGADVADDRASVAVFLPEATSDRVLADLRAGSPVAVTFSRPATHRTVQIKGEVRAMSPAVDSDRLTLERYRAAFMEQLHVVGVPRSLSRRMAYWPCHAVRVSVDEVFDQTPGPMAGMRMDT